jgi:hypothetical protein
VISNDAAALPHFLPEDPSNDNGALDNIERIDRLITIAESRRNGIFREIDRRRTMLGEVLRRKMQEVESEFKVIDKTPEAKSAA